MSQTADFAKQRTFLVSFVNFVSAQQKKKEKDIKVCVFFFWFIHFLDLKNKQKDSAKII